jgi:hypothetical protein
MTAALPYGALGGSGRHSNCCGATRCVEMRPKLQPKSRKGQAEDRLAAGQSGYIPQGDRVCVGGSNGHVCCRRMQVAAFMCCILCRAWLSLICVCMPPPSEQCCPSCRARPSLVPHKGMHCRVLRCFSAHTSVHDHMPSCCCCWVFPPPPSPPPPTPHPAGPCAWAECAPHRPPGCVCGP